MEKYEQLSVVGEGSYGIVLKCRHRDTDQIVAIKKFLETEEDATVRRMALREIRMLKRLKHENLVTMIEVFRYRKRFYLVFEYLEGTVLDELEKMPNGLGDDRCRERIYQVTRAINYCHCNHIIHRDVKPENVLVSSLGVVKLCDFGFARLVSPGGEPCTEYVATRWYRAPELLVGENNYGAAVDVWAIGCLFAEMMTGDPLFPGESDIDQLFLIVKLLGKPCNKHQHLMAKNTQLRGMLRTAAIDAGGLYKTFPNWSLLSLDFLACCMKMDPNCRPTAEELLRHNFFHHDRFPQRFLPALREKVTLEFNNNPLLRRYKTEVIMSTDKKDEINKARRSSQTEAPRWKFNFTEGSVKRKFSCDTVNGDILGSDKSLISSSRNSQKPSITQQQKSGQYIIKQCSLSKSNNKQSISTPKLSQTIVEHGKSSEIQKLEKSLESLSKLSRPASVQKEDKSGSSPTLQPSSPQYQSLQSNLIDFNKSPSLYSQSCQNILHPSINNISFGKEPITKKSPNILQTIHNTSIKHTFNQVPLLNPPRGQFMKKLDRNITIDNMLSSMEPVCVQSNITGPPWLSSFGSQHKKKEQKLKSDNFTLPEVPGATSSPNKPRKKTSPEALDSNEVSPRIQSSTSQKSASSKLLNGLQI